MIAILFASIAPVFALMSFFYLKDRFTEPIEQTAKVFCAGILLVFPIMFLQYTFHAEDIFTSGAIASCMIVGFLEELCKWLVFIFLVYHHKDFDAHYDGIVYAVAISLGFAMAENLMYLTTNGIEYAFGRAVFPVSSHALFGVVMGYYFGKAKIIRKHQRISILLAFIFPFLLHSLYNYIIEIAQNDWLILLIIFMLLLWVFGMRQMRLANHIEMNQRFTDE